MSGQDNVVNLKRPREWADDCAALWFHLQELKKKMRRQFIEDFKTMISKNASTEELLDRLLKHERARRTTRDAHNVATENTAAEPTYWQLVRDLDDYGIAPEYKAHVLFCRPLTPEEQAEIENWQAMLDEGLSEHDKEVRQFWHEHPHVARRREGIA